jgi:hypothetical protein
MLAVASRGWTGISPVADDAPMDWNRFFAVIKEHYPRFRYFGIPKWAALMGTHALTPYRRLSRYPSLYTPDAVLSWNLNIPVKKGVLWNELALEPKYPTAYQGIPSALDDCIAFRWIHPIEDRMG